MIVPVRRTAVPFHDARNQCLQFGHVLKGVLVYHRSKTLVQLTNGPPCGGVGTPIGIETRAQLTGVNQKLASSFSPR